MKISDIPWKICKCIINKETVWYNPSFLMEKTLAQSKEKNIRNLSNLKFSK